METWPSGRRQLLAKESTPKGVREFESHRFRHILKREIMYIKPSKTYKMSKPLKVSLALGKFKNSDQKGAWKRAMIQAELAAAIVPKSTKGDRDNKRPQGASYVTNDTGTASTAE